MMKKILQTLPLFAVILILGGVVYAGKHYTPPQPVVVNQTPGNVELGDGNINPLDQWKSDGTNITQRTASKPIKLTGLESLGCLGTNGSGIVGAGTCTGGGGGSGTGNVATSTNEHAGRVAYFTTTSGSPAKLGEVSTSSIANGTGITVTNGATAFVLGAQPTINCNTASASVFGCLNASDFSKFNSATTTFSTGLTYTGATNAVTVNTSQNINTLSNLTTNGAVYTVGGTGSLQVVGTSTPTATSPITYSGTLGQFLGGVSGAFGCATCAVTGTTLTVAGTANQITSSAGAQDLSANRTWTLSLPSLVVFPGNASSTQFSTAIEYSNFFKATSTTATSTIANALAITAGQANGTSSLLPADGTLNVGCTNNTGLCGQFYRDLGATAQAPLVLIRDDNTAVTQGALRVMTDGTNGGAYNIRLDGVAPQIEWVENDQVAPAGKFETGVNGDIFYIASRNSGDTSFENAFEFDRKANGGAFRQFGTSASYFTGNLGVASTTPTFTLSVGNANTGTFGISTTTDGCPQFTKGLMWIGTCAGGGSVTSVVAGAGFQNQGLNITGSGTLVGAFATSATPVLGNLPYFTGVGDASNPAKFGTVATTSLTSSAPLSLSQPISVLGASASVLTCTTASSGVAGCLSNTAFDTFNNKQTAITTSFPLQLSAGTLSWIGLATTSNIVNGQAIYATGVNTIASVATSSIANGTNITVTNGSSAYVFGSQPTINLSGVVAYANGGTGTTTAPQGQLLYGGLTAYQSVATTSLGITAPITFSGTLGAQVGGVSGNFGCTDSSAGVKGCLNGTDWSTFNNKQATISVTSPITLTGASVGIVNQGTVAQVLHGNASGNASFGAIVNADITNTTIDLTTKVTGILPIANGGTNQSVYPLNSIIGYDGTRFVATSSASSLTVFSINATSTTATSTYAGRLQVGTTTPLSTGSATFTIKGLMSAVMQIFTSAGTKIMDITDTVVTLLGTWDFSAVTDLVIPTGTAPTMSKTGSISYDTTDNQLLVATTTANTPGVLPLMQKLWGGTIASTSIDFISGGRIPLPPLRKGAVITEIHCYVDGGTSKVINLDTLASGANTDSVTCAGTDTSDTAMSANYSMADGATEVVEFGATSGTVDYVTFSVYGYYNRQ